MNDQLTLLKLLGRAPRSALQIQRLLKLKERASVTKRMKLLKAKGWIRIADWLRTEGRSGAFTPLYGLTQAGRVAAGLKPTDRPDESVAPPKPLTQYERDQRWKAGRQREAEHAAAEREARRQEVDATIARLRSMPPANIFPYGIVQDSATNH